MRLLIGLVVLSLLALALVAWRIIAAGVPAASVSPPVVAPTAETRAADVSGVTGSVGAIDDACATGGLSASGKETRADKPPVAQDAPGPVAQDALETVAQDALGAVPGEAARQEPRPPKAPAPASAPVHWAADGGPRGSLRRLAAARAVLSQEPEHLTALRDELAALYELGRWSEAANTLSRLVDLQPEDTRLRFEYAEALVRLGYWSSALRPLRAYVAEVPDDAQAWRYVAAAQQTLGHLRSAEQSWSRVLELEPEDAAALGNRGKVRLDMWRWPEAVADLEQADRLEPGVVDVVLDLALSLAPIGRMAEAQQRVMAVLEDHPRNARAMGVLAELTWRDYLNDPVGTAEQLDRTITWCRRSLAIDPHQPSLQAILDAAEDARED